jgi:hypothetical protein
LVAGLDGEESVEEARTTLVLVLPTTSGVEADVLVRKLPSPL